MTAGLYGRKIGPVEFVYAQGKKEQSDRYDNEKPQLRHQNKSVDIVCNPFFNKLRGGETFHMHGDEPENRRDVSKRIEIHNRQQENRHNRRWNIGSG